MTERLHALEAKAFRTGRTLVEHGEQLGEIREQQAAAVGNIDSLPNAVGAPGDRTITQRLDAIDPCSVRSGPGSGHRPGCSDLSRPLSPSPSPVDAASAISVA